MEESNKELAINQRSIHWKVDQAAPTEDVKSFWKKLRHYYRTGEKEIQSEEVTLSSALLPFLELGNSRYPYKLSDEEDTSVDLGDDTLFIILNHLLIENQKENKRKFKNQISELIEGLHGIFKVENKTTKATELKQTFDFAEAMIAFDKMVEIIPQNKQEELSETRLNRIRAVVDTLREGLLHFGDQMATVMAEERYSTELERTDLINQTNTIKAEKEIFEEVQKLVTQEIHGFSELIKAYRIASLEINGEYQEDVQDEYFEHFTWHRLFEDELNLFQPIALVVSHQYVFNHLSAYSKLLASNLPIKIIVLNEERISKPNHGISWEDASHQFKQELALLTIAHRNVYTFQAGLDDPACLSQGLKACVQSPSPSVCHVSTLIGNSDDLSALAVKAGRFFPTIKYDPNSDKKEKRRIDISKNLEPDKSWPKLMLKANTTQESVAEIETNFTYADYKAIYPEKAKELMLIPSAYYTTDLVPLSDYLMLDEKVLYGKIPYIWLVDEQQELHRAAVPNVWVVSCQERLDFWSYLQALGATDMEQQGIDQSKSQKEAINKEILDKVAVEAQYPELIAQIKEEAMANATERVIATLLDMEDGELESFLANDEELEPIKASKLVDEQKLEHTTKDKVNEIEPPASPTSKSNEAWVDSENCTTCNDCTDKYSNLFAYNEEQQAYIKDATKGTYEQLVKAAENCPAACIHPGLPLNPKERNIDALIKRAEKFN